MLAGAVGALAGAAAAALAKPSAVRAEGEAMVVGGEYTTASSQTSIKNTANDQTVFAAESAMGGVALRAQSWTGRAIYAASEYGMGVSSLSSEDVAIRGASYSGTQPAVQGISIGNTTGVLGYCGNFPFPEPRPNTGVFGYSVRDAASNGVIGQSDAGNGVRGESVTGIGVLGLATGTSGPGAFGVFARSESPEAAAIGARSASNMTGVLAMSGLGTLPAPKAKTGVYGYAAQDTNSRGVWGHSPAGRGIQGTSTTGYAGYFSGKVFTDRFVEFSEIATPPTAGTDRARLFARDNGSGKTQLCVRFQSGAVRVLATEP
jgi:hypothetical protein